MESKLDFNTFVEALKYRLELNSILLKEDMIECKHSIIMGDLCLECGTIIIIS